MNLKEKIRELPSSPGVYLMKDSLNSIIYVGKSKNLKNRVGSYFQNSKSHSPKVIKLVKNLKDFDYILTDTEFEAFILECKLIKTIKPIYNRQMKNPKSYSYIKIIVNEKYPGIEISNESSEIDGNIYFGPYTSRNTVERGIDGIKEFCKILCSNNFRKTSSCLNYSLGLCIGMCLDNTPIKQYLNIFDKIIKLLGGDDKSLLTEMEHKMNSLSDNFDFEKAAKYRDYISAVNYLIDKFKVIEFAEENKNIALLEPLGDNIIKFFLIKGNKLLFSKKYILKDIENLKSIMKNNILFYFKDKGSKNLIGIGKEDIDEAQIIYSYLKNKSNSCNYVIISEKCFSSLNEASINKILDKLLFSMN
ncbi:UvrB/UvrC motif-containing protein [Clostridium pasteurianum]|uniref:Putative endonuclease n=1 Tax=Clostridium pasteurianum BC1 TaxID=86416 RepID=R4KA10_CLOPA|nr:UvrB/UvrC motif-containing protein [Clostridium pasteurianum]AGK99418.1 putative endonuclease [Clostridium pasteurianum BC1]